MMQRIIPFFLTFSMCFVCNFMPGIHVVAEDFEVIRLKHRPGEEIVPILKGTFGDTLNISSIQNKLVVRGDKKSITELKKLLSELDRKSKMLTITIDEDQATAGSGTSIGVTARYNEPIRVHGNAYDTKLKSKGKRTIQVLEGSIAEIGSLQNESGGKIRVRPTVTGETVHLEVISELKDKQNVSDAKTSITAKRGEWIDVGGVDQSNEKDAKYLVGKDSTRSVSNSRIRIRVE